MQDSTMVYRCPGAHKIHGGMFDYVVVPDEEIASKLEDGWYLTTSEAAEHHANKQAEAALQAQRAAKEKALADARALIAEHEGTKDDAPPTKEELQQRLRDLGIPFHHRAGVAALTELLPKD